MRDCDAEVKADFAEDGEITFKIEIAECSDSAGEFEFEGVIAKLDGSKTTIRKRETWLRTVDRSTATVEYEFRLGGGEKLVDVSVLSVDCQCHER